MTPARRVLSIAFLLGVASTTQSEVYRSTTGVCFEVNDAYRPGIEKLIRSVRQEIATARDAGMFVGYLSVPLSTKGGGLFDVNEAIAEEVAENVRRRFGSKLFIINPGSYELPPLSDVHPSGDDYMAVWSDVIGGEDGEASELDMVYFAGPEDMFDYFRADQEPRGQSNEDECEQCRKCCAEEAPDIIGTIESWMSRNEQVERLTPERRRDFLRYYAFRASSAYSLGAHDEWNLIQLLNSKRDIPNQIAVFYNKRAVEPGDFEDRLQRGNQDSCAGQP